MALLKIQDKAPKFSGIDQNNNKISSSDFKGKIIVLFFYPKDNTPGCTAEACSIRDNYSMLLKKNIAIIGISIDDPKSHKKFIEKFDLPFPLIADIDKKIVSDYGVWVEKSMYGRNYMGTARNTFIINEKGIITAHIEKVDTKNHAAQILEKLTA